MKKIILLAMVTLLGLFLAGTVRGEESAKGESQTKSGIVKKVDVAAKQVVVMVTRELTFNVTDATQIVQGKTPVKIGDIKVESHVTVEYVKSGEARVAKKITLSDRK